MAYPREYGPRVPRALPDMATPLAIDRGNPDEVPDNDTAGVAPPLSTGGEFRDPLALVSVIYNKGRGGR